MSGCSIRALWILNPHDTVLFSRRFPTVERRWRIACNLENDRGAGENLMCAVHPLVPSDAELASAVAERRTREGSLRGFGIRLSQSAQGSDSWVDDPITRHILGLYINREDGDDRFLLWPLVMHLKGNFTILVLPLVEPRQVKDYERMHTSSLCGTSVGERDKFSSLLLNLPCITGAFMVAHSIGDIIAGDIIDPEVLVSSSPSVGGLLDSLTGSIGISSISARTKPISAPVATSSTSSASVAGSASLDALKGASRAFDKDALRTFISGSMPFGTPLDLSFSNISFIKGTGFASLDLPPSDLKQPAWKPYLYKGKQRLLFTIHETIFAALYDREEISDFMTISGQVNCRAELEGLPDVSLPLTGLNASQVEILSFHPCAQVSEQGIEKQALMFSPPLGNFALLRYQAFCSSAPVKGFYQLSMVSEDEGAFLFKLRLMEGYKAPLSMDFCNVTMPFPLRRVSSYDGNPSMGTVSMTEHSVEWKIVLSGRSIMGKSVEATFSGTVRFFPLSAQRPPSFPRSISESRDGEDSDVEQESSTNLINMEEYLVEKMNKNLLAVDLEEPFSWHAYNYAKVSFKVFWGILSGLSIDPRHISIYPAVKAPVEFSMQVSSGDYILWNTLGRCPVAATCKG